MLSYILEPPQAKSCTGIFSILEAISPCPAGGQISLLCMVSQPYYDHEHCNNLFSLLANSEQKRKWNRETVRASENINFKLKEDEAIPKSQKLYGIRKGRLSTTHESAVHLHLILIQAESHRNNLSVIYFMVRKKERKTLWHLKVIS